MMKKLLTIFTCLVLVAVFSMPVSATQPFIPDGMTVDPVSGLIVGSTSKEAKVQYSVGMETYEVKIPANIMFSTNNYEIDKEISVTSAVLAKGRYLNLTVSSNHAWKMHTHTQGEANLEYYIPYTMTYPKYTWTDGHPSDTSEETVVNSNYGTSKVVLLQAHGVSELTKIDITFNMDDREIPSTGVYQDILTFEISIEGDIESTDPAEPST